METISALLQWMIWVFICLFAALHVINIAMYTIRSYSNRHEQKAIDDLIALSLSLMIKLIRAWNKEPRKQR